MQTSMRNLRLYTFINFYLSSIQQGIQTQHVDRELTNKYVYGEYPQHNQLGGETNALLREWSLHHKTTITLNGGINESLHALYQFLMDSPVVFEHVNMPFAKFHEDTESLGGILTGVAIVLPEEVYDAVPYGKMLALSVDAATFVSTYDRTTYGEAYFWQDPETNHVRVFNADSVIGSFLSKMKACPLAR